MEGGGYTQNTVQKLELNGWEKGKPAGTGKRVSDSYSSGLQGLYLQQHINLSYHYAFCSMKEVKLVSSL